MSEFEFNQVEEPTPDEGTPETGEGKPAFFSSTIWGLIVAVVGVLLPDLSSQLDGIVAQVVSIVGIITAAWGRIRATKSITSLFPKLF